MMDIREVGAVDLLNVIVHVIDKQNATQAQKSNGALDVFNLDARVKNFIIDHIRTSVLNNESKEAKFKNNGSNVQVLVNQILHNPTKKFVMNSGAIADLLYAETPLSAAAGCIIVTRYTNSIEEFLAIIKLDKSDAFSYEKVKGTYELIPKENSLPMPTKRSKLHKFAVIRDSSTIPEDQLDSVPALLVLDKQVAKVAQFFFDNFLKAEFLHTDSYKSTKLVEGLVKYLRSEPDLAYSDRKAILNTFGKKLMDNEQFTIDEAAQQILSPYFNTAEELENAVEKLERTLLENGMGDNNLRGELTDKVRQMLSFDKIQTLEQITIDYPAEYLNERVFIEPSKNNDGTVDITIKGVHLRT